MKTETRQGLLAFVGLAIIAVVIIGAIVAVRYLLGVLTSLDSDLAVAIIAAAATVLVSVLSVVLGNIYEAREQVQREHREKKIPVYEDLIAFLFRVLLGVKTGSAPTEEDMLKFMSEFNQRAMVWGSDEVLAAWIKWRRAAINSSSPGTQPLELVFLYEELILAIRRDLGHKNSGLKRGDILALFVNDIDKHLS